MSISKEFCAQLSFIEGLIQIQKWMKELAVAPTIQLHRLSIIIYWDNRTKIRISKFEITVEPHFSGVFGHREFFRSCEDFR